MIILFFCFKMELLEDEDTKNSYNECKYKVTLWEREFKKKHKRLPCKLDIREASVEVWNAYKTYHRLKTAALEESLMNLDGFDGDAATDNLINDSANIIDVDLENVQSTSSEGLVDKINNKNANDTWGFHLNKVYSPDNKFKPTEAKVNVNKSLSQKLFQGSKSSKRLPRKSLSFVRKKSDSNQKQQQFLSQPETSVSNDNLDASISSMPQSDTTHLLNNYKAAMPVINVHSQPINLLKSVVSGNSSLKPLRQLDPGWIERLTCSMNIDETDKNAIGENTELDYDSDDVIANSEDELDSSCNRLIKKAKIGSEEQNVQNSCATSHVEPVRLDFRNIFNKSSTVQPVEILEKFVDNKKNDGTISKSRNCKNKDFNFELSGAENDDPFHTDDDTNDPEFQILNKELTDSKSNHTQILDDVNSSKKVNKRKISKSKQVKNKSKAKETSSKSVPEHDLTNEIYELEYSVKPRTVTVPRIKNIKQILCKKNVAEGVTTKCDKLSNRQQQLVAKLEQKANSGSLNDNYVQINLKKKIYVRGKSTNTYSKFKKQQWKNKKKALYGPDMDMGGCDGGTLSCFNCGENGHFARTCPKKKLDLLLPLSEHEEEPCPYPSLEEAAKMAHESPLVIRKPNQVGEGNTGQSELEVQVDNSVDVFSDDCDDELLAETQRLEEEIKKIDVQKYIDLTSFVAPYYQTNENGSLIDTPAEVFEALQKFGYSNFRAGQEQAIMRILSGKSTLVTLSTGSGKSLCYQLPAYLYSKREPCISLIISPLVSLMEDQVTGIPKFLNAACLHNNQSKIQKDKIVEAIKSGNLNVLLVSPEAVVAGEKSSGFGSLLRKLPPIAFACIDEAHCVSQWSHNFRPSYLKICRVLRDRLGVNTILGLTATATRATCDSIINHFNIRDGRDGIIQDIPLPDNLKLTISCDIQKDQALLSLLLSDTYAECKSIIVYCTRREECLRVATFLRTSLKYNSLANNDNADNKKRKRHSLLAEPYHAGLSASRRKSIQKAFMSGELRIVVATVAFGMGINKPDLRSVIHYNMPMSFESYVQEVGRAGRDGLPAYCHLFLNAQGNDENELLRHVYANSTDRHIIRKLLQRCFLPCSCKSTCPRHEVAFSIQDTVQTLDVPEENIETLLCYLELHEKRYIELLSNAYTNCKIISYGGANIINKTAKDCPPLAMALAMFRKKDDQTNVFEFPVVDVASAMGWDSGICKHILKNLEWITVNGCQKRSQLSVQFLNLGFRLLSPGNLSDSELDEALDTLHERVKEQERTSVLQLHAIHSSLSLVAAPTYKNCCLSNVENDKTESILKSKIREYFASPKPLDFVTEVSTKPINEELITSNVRSLICMYRDNTFTGRAVARIFHGIQSPNYPALLWGRCKFWRLHLGEDFNAIVQIATREILRMR